MSVHLHNEIAQNSYILIGTYGDVSFWKHPTTMYARILIDFKGQAIQTNLREIPKGKVLKNWLHKLEQQNQSKSVTLEDYKNALFEHFPIQSKEHIITSLEDTPIESQLVKIYFDECLEPISGRCYRFGRRDVRGYYRILPKYVTTISRIDRVAFIDKVHFDSRSSFPSTFLQPLKRSKHNQPSTKQYNPKPKTRSNTMNLRSVAALVDETITTVQAVFSGTERKYSFKCLIALAETLKVDDLVLADTVNGIAIVKIIGISKESQINPESTYQYKHIFQKVNLDSLAALEERSNRIHDKLKVQQRVSVRKQTLALLGIDSQALLAELDEEAKPKEVKDE